MEILVPSHVGIHNVIKTIFKMCFHFQNVKGFVSSAQSCWNSQCGQNFFQIAFELLQHFNLTGCYLNIFLILK